jgi:hypothetical protein
VGPDFEAETILIVFLSLIYSRFLCFPAVGYSGDLKDVRTKYSKLIL